MTAANLAKARAAKAERDAERRELGRARVDEYLAWLPVEREAYERVLRLRQEFGHGAGEVQDAEDEWRKTVATMPALPPDSAWS
jgi:hypothetical protein